MQAIRYFKALYAIESQARDNNLTAEKRLALRQEQAVPILNEFKQWLLHNITKVPKQHQLGRGIYYVLNNWESLNNYLLDGRLKIDNNEIENLIRSLALGRKNFLFMVRLEVQKRVLFFIASFLLALLTRSNLINIFVPCYTSYLTAKRQKNIKNYCRRILS